MFSNSLNSGQLRTKLRALGFRERSFEVEGKGGRIYQENGAELFLPDKLDTEAVDPSTRSYVLLVLRSHDPISEPNPLLTIRMKKCSGRPEPEVYQCVHTHDSVSS